MLLTNANVKGCQCKDVVYIYERLRPRKNNPQQQKKKKTQKLYINEIEHQTS
jgi:hypothetical protein